MYPPKEFQIKLVSRTNLPIETLFAVWRISRSSEFQTAQEVWSANGTLDEEMLGTFDQIIKAQLPVAEFAHFVWGFQNIPINLREQWVRERQWSFWLQTGRITDASTFVDEGRYHVPGRFKDNPELLKTYLDGLLSTQETYKNLVKLGGVIEEAREVLPQALTHNGSAACNLRTLITTFGKRSCWVAQIDLWYPLLMGMKQELLKISPKFNIISSPPCMSGNKFAGCKYSIECEKSISGEYKNVGCPLYEAATKENGKDAWTKRYLADPFAKLLFERYKSYWGRDPWTGRQE